MNAKLYTPSSVGSVYLSYRDRGGLFMRLQALCESCNRTFSDNFDFPWLKEPTYWVMRESKSGDPLQRYQVHSEFSRHRPCKYIASLSHPSSRCESLHLYPMSWQGPNSGAHPESILQYPLHELTWEQGWSSPFFSHSYVPFRSRDLVNEHKIFNFQE